YEAADPHKLPDEVDRRQSMLCRQLDQPASMKEKRAALEHDKPVRLLLSNCRECAVQLVRRFHLDELKLHSSFLRCDLGIASHLLRRLPANSAKVPQACDTSRAASHLLEQLHTLGEEFHADGGQSGDIATRLGKAGCEPFLDRINHESDDRDRGAR